MSKLNQNVEENKLLQSANYLAVALRVSKVEIVDKLTQRLNKKKLRPLQKAAYTSTIVTAVVYGKYSDEYVAIELAEWESEVKGIKNQVSGLLDEARRLNRQVVGI